nr:hypothetical protein [Tanacetum cinerariifolium]
MGGNSAQTRFERVLEQPNEPPLPEGHTSGSGEDTLEENIKLTDTVPTPYDSPLTRGYIPGSNEVRITLAELMETCTTLSNKVTQLENGLSTTKAVYNKAFITLTNKLKKLESQLKQKRSSAVILSSDEEVPSVHIEDSAKQGRIVEEMDKDKNINLLSLDEELAQKLYAKELAKEEARQERERYNLEKAMELQRQLDQRKENIPKGDQANEIDWNDPQVLRYHALQNRPFSKAEVRKNMIMYLRNQGGYKQSYFKGMKAGFDLHQGSSKKQRLDQQTEAEAKAQGDSDQEVEELKLYMRIIPEEDIAIEAIPLAIKPPVIIEEDLETFWKLVKDKYGNTRPEDGRSHIWKWGGLEENIKLTNTVPTPYDSPLTGGYTPKSDEGRITLAELMETCTTLSTRVTQLENELSTTKVVYNKAFITLTNKVKKLESQLKQKRSSAVILSSDEEVLSAHIKDSPKQGRIIEEMNKDKNINLVSEQREVQETAEHSRDDDDETLTETLLNIKRSSAKDKGKRIMQETELAKKLKKKEMIQLSLDEELAKKLYAEELEKEEARQERERYNLEKAMEYHALQNRPFSKAEVRKNMIMYLKNQGGYKQSYFKGMKYEDIRPLFKRIWDQVYTFISKYSEIEKEVMKRAGFDLHQGSSKKQRLDQQTEEEAEAQGDSDQEVEELKLYMRIIPEEDIAIKAIALAIKPLVIIKYKIVKEGKISIYHITRADGSTRRYTLMINLLENIDREDLETLWKLVKDKYGNTRPEEGYERVLWGDLKVMFEPDIKSEHIFLRMDKVYPLSPTTIKMMLERKLQADQWNEMCYQLLKLIMKQLRKQ